MKFYINEREKELLNFINSLDKEKFEYIAEDLISFGEFSKIVEIHKDFCGYYIESEHNKIYGLSDFFMNFTQIYGFDKEYNLNVFDIPSDDLYDKLNQFDDKMIFWENFDKNVFNSRNLFLIKEIDGKMCMTKNELFKTFKEKLNIESTINSWNNFSKYINDLHWLQKDKNIKHIYVYLSNFEYFLLNDSQNLKNFIKSISNKDNENYNYDVRVNFIIDKK